MRKKLVIEEHTDMEWNGNKMKAGDSRTIKRFKLGSKGFLSSLTFQGQWILVRVFKFDHKSIKS